MKNRPLTRKQDGKWIENMNDSIDHGDYWFMELNLKSIVEGLKGIFKDKERYNGEYVRDQIDQRFPDLQKITNKSRK